LFSLPRPPRDLGGSNPPDFTRPPAGPEQPLTRLLEKTSSFLPSCPRPPRPHRPPLDPATYVTYSTGGRFGLNPSIPASRATPTANPTTRLAAVTSDGNSPGFAVPALARPPAASALRGDH
jgi:hypothetical protein